MAHSFDNPVRRIPQDDFERALFRERLSRFFTHPNISADLGEFDEYGTLPVTIFPGAQLAKGELLRNWLSGPASVGRAWLGERQGANGSWIVAICCGFPDDAAAEGVIVDRLPIFLWLDDLLQAAAKRS